MEEEKKKREKKNINSTRKTNSDANNMYTKIKTESNLTGEMSKTRLSEK